MGKIAPLITAIGAVSRNGMIGLDHWLPWDIPEELAYFERTVSGGALVIGRHTYASMEVVPADSFIVSHQADLSLRPGCTQVVSVEAGIAAASATGKPVFVIGGASIYAAAWPYCHRFLLTRIERDFVGDVRFPESIPLDLWRVQSEFHETYLERKTGEPVLCRFIEYVQDAPRPLPTGV